MAGWVYHWKDRKMTYELFQCSDCHHTYRCDNVCNYAKDPMTHETICYNCIADREESLMVNHDKIILYLVNEGKEYVIKNYAGTMNFKVNELRVSHHNIGPDRTDVFFTGPDGKKWHGVRYGNNLLLRCNKPKRQRKHLMSLNKNSYRSRFKYD